MQTLGVSNELENARVIKSVSVILDPKDQAERNINPFARQTKPSQPIIRMIFFFKTLYANIRHSVSGKLNGT